MATKDWKKITKKPHGEFWQNQKTGQKLILTKALPNGFIIMTNAKIIKVTKNKTLALKFIKSYIRKH